MEKLPIMGVIKSISYTERKAVVCVWKRGDEFLVNGRLNDQYPLRCAVAECAVIIWLDF